MNPAYQINSVSASLSFIFIFFSSTMLVAEDSPYLLGDWNGSRTVLEEQGISFESVLTYDVMSNTRGGVKTGTAGLANFNFIANFDLDKLEIIEGGTFFTYFLGNFGNSPSTNYIGDFQVANNIDTLSAFKVYEFWYQQNFMDDSLSFLVGMHDYNSEFSVLNNGINLMHSSFGIGPDIAQVPPSIFASTTLGARVRFEPSENTYGIIGFYDGLPGDPNHPRRSTIKLSESDGLFTAYEVGYLEDSVETYKKFSVGGWYSTQEYEDFKEEGRDNNSGVYILNEAKLLDEGNEDAQGLGYFNAIGFAKSDRNQTDFYIGGGFMYTGIIPNRNNDVFSIGLANARNSRDFVNSTSSERYEKALEIQYKVQITEYFTVAPDFQYIMNPGMNPELKDSVVLGLRTEIAM